METPLKISFQNSQTSEPMTALINEHVASLEKLYGRMTSCHVTLRIPDRQSGFFAVHIHGALPGGGDIAIDHTPSKDERFREPAFAVNDAFRRAKRQLKSFASRQRGDVKTLHERIERTLDRPES
jgi:ribosome-associated translation inhibitor RaiA